MTNHLQTTSGQSCADLEVFRVQPSTVGPAAHQSPPRLHMHLLHLCQSSYQVPIVRRMCFGPASERPGEHRLLPESSARLPEESFGRSKAPNYKAKLSLLTIF